ncbi:WecB/TagA/CpsF family glycosyltransferase [Lactobacillus psittaci]|uniref:N-acetylglucosaminyldiphosphoundecaprenol N-acetyl-beta-D-mannosaminyltransferase n=1 Tax=Lactobacillus psittaci DSM 15354 TaxID=1122152 RepID=A0A0R1S900_9LACO|nr:WecB/TagA/CpsF family glycosyltransferase [Lactobacillus psittaci]KRL62680.1 UDP-N-acetyl-D-mannosamine transferase [Lactobacillus psittaci DSM 15354]
MTTRKIDILGVKFDNYDFDTFYNNLLTRLDAGSSTMVVTANPEIVMAANENPLFMKLINETADFVSPDGIGVVKAAKILNTPLKERVTGYDLFCNLLKAANQRASKVYFVGAKEEVIQDLRKKVQAKYPQIQIVGCENGYFKEDLEIVARRIKKVEPDMVFSALGYPRQEQLLAILRKQDLPAIMMGVGGSFDVFSGHTKRAPKFYQNAHLEWLYRLLKEPSRLGRMLVLPRFVGEVYREKRGRRRK